MSPRCTKTLLVVGGGFGQIPAILSARDLGIRIVVVDRNPGAIGMPLADIALPIDILDTEAVVRAAREHGVDGALTMQSDVGVPTVSAVVEALGLPGNGPVVARDCSNKIATRRLLARCGIAQPKFEVIATISQALAAAGRIGFPCVIKAPDSSGSRGVVKINSPDEVGAALQEAMRWTRGVELLVEQFIHGTEIGAQAFSEDGKCIMVLVHDDDVSPAPHMVPIGHGFPSPLLPETLERVEKAVMSCVDAIGIISGASNIDIIFDGAGEAKIIEVGARIGATCLPELIQYHTGIDWVKVAVRAAIGDLPEIHITKKQPCAAYILESPTDGIFHGYTISDEFKGHPDILEWEVTAKPGDVVSRLRKGTDRIGKVVAKGGSLDAAKRLAIAFRSSIVFDVRPTLVAHT